MQQLLNENQLLSFVGLFAAGFGAGIGAIRILVMLPSVAELFPTWTRTSAQAGRATVADLIASSNLSMYFADENLLIRECNQELARFLDMGKERIIGRGIGDISRESRPLIDVHQRERFDAEQKTLEERAKLTRAPSGDANYIFDLRAHSNHQLRHRYDVNIHYDFVRLGGKGKVAGVFGVLFRKEI